MSWKRSWNGKRKKDRPNSQQNKPTISFRSQLAPEVLGYIKKISEQKGKSEFINKAVSMRYFYFVNKKKFIEEIVRNNFHLSRSILRKIGSKRNSYKQNNNSIVGKTDN